MSIQLQLRRGPEEDHESFIGAPGEVTVDTSKNTLRVHDGVTPGGHELAKFSLSNALITKSLTPKLTGQIDVGTLSNKWRDLYLSNSIKLSDTTITQDSTGVNFATPYGNFGINQSLRSNDSPTFENLTITGTIVGYDKGSPFSVVANEAERNELALDEENRIVGMLALTTDNNKIWQLKPDYATWQEFIPRSAKQTTFHTISAIESLDISDFDLDIGNSVIVYSVEVSHPCMFEVFESDAREDTNPYRFIATDDHLKDDGSTLMSDGSVLRGRRYHIWSNINNLNKIYCRVSNISDEEITGFRLDITYSVLEYSLVV